MPLPDPDTLAHRLLDLGWKPPVIPLVVALLHAEDVDTPITLADLNGLRELAYRYWADPTARRLADLDQWRSRVALAVVRMA